MAVGVPCVLPAHSALNEWPEGNALYADCYPFPNLTDRGLNTIHHLTEVDSAIEALHKLYTDAQLRQQLGEASYKHMQNPKFNWETIAKQFMEIIKNGKDRD